MIHSTRGFRVFMRRLALGLCVASLSIASAASPVAAANDIAIHAFIGDCQFTGINAGSKKKVSIEWVDEDRELKSKHTVTADSAGRFTSRCENGEEIEVGDMLSAKVGSKPAHVLGVPALSAKIDRDANTVFVKSWPGSPMAVDLYTYNGTFNLLTLDTHEWTMPGIGWYWDDFSAADIKGYDFANVYWQGVAGDLIGRTVMAPALTAWIGRPFIEAVGNAGTEFKATLKDGTGSVTYARTGGYLWEGRNGFYLYDDEGVRVRTAAGNRLDADLGGSPGGYIVPRVTANIFKGNDTVQAFCDYAEPAGVAVDVYARDGSGLRSRLGMTSSGMFVANFAAAPKHNIVPGDKVDVYCKLASGDVIARRFTVP